MKHPIIRHLVLAAACVLPWTAAYAQSPSEADRALLVENLAEADANADGALDRTEFEVLINLNAADNLGRAAMIVRTGRYGTVFSRIDANADGLLTQPEMEALAQQMQG